MGNVGDDPRMNQINETMKVARFPLATNEVYTDKEGNEENNPESQGPGSGIILRR